MQKPGKIVVASQHYPPDSSTTAAIMSAIAEHLALDEPVVVLSGTSGSASAASENSNWATVIEVKNWMPGKTALIKRAIAEILFVVRVFLALLMKLQRGDVALTVTAPFMLPYAVVAAAKLKRARSVLIMHDLYPDVLVMSGLLRPSSLLTKLIHGANALMFRMLDAVVIIGRDTERPLLRYRGMTRDKIRFIPNWATKDGMSAAPCEPGRAVATRF
jgi:colanic acid biosynthesis glycosyl transferase WcaI